MKSNIKSIHVLASYFLNLWFNLQSSSQHGLIASSNPSPSWTRASRALCLLPDWGLAPPDCSVAAVSPSPFFWEASLLLGVSDRRSPVFRVFPSGVIAMLWWSPRSSSFLRNGEQVSQTFLVWKRPLIEEADVTLDFQSFLKFFLTRKAYLLSFSLIPWSVTLCHRGTVSPLPVMACAGPGGDSLVLYTLRICFGEGSWWIIICSSKTSVSWC